MVLLYVLPKVQYISAQVNSARKTLTYTQITEAAFSVQFDIVTLR